MPDVTHARAHSCVITSSVSDVNDQLSSQKHHVLIQSVSQSVRRVSEEITVVPRVWTTSQVQCCVWFNELIYTYASCGAFTALDNNNGGIYIFIIPSTIVTVITPRYFLPLDLFYYLAGFFFHSALELNGSLFCVRWLFELLWKMYKRQSVGKFIAMETVSLTVRTVCNARACVYKDCVSASFKWGTFGEECLYANV